MTAAVAVIGSRDDPHVMAVLGCLPSRGVLVTDVTSLAAGQYVFQPGELNLVTDESVLVLAAQRPSRGWIRRVAPADWQRGVVIESREAAAKTAWLSLLTGVIRTCGVAWLTDVDALVISESKIVQYAAARKLGVPTPTTIVTNDAAEVQSVLGGELVLKPLGPGHFFDGDIPYGVFATSVSTDHPALASMGGAPFLAQERLAATAHLRLVTVGEQTWAARLDASGRPLDWRRDPSAHHAFVAIGGVDSQLADWGISIARELRLGYTSQDWIVTDHGPYLLDVNPGGQWLFLPRVVADSVTRAVADWLVEASGDE